MAVATLNILIMVIMHNTQKWARSNSQGGFWLSSVSDSVCATISLLGEQLPHFILESVIDIHSITINQSPLESCNTVDYIFWSAIPFIIASSWVSIQLFIPAPTIKSIRVMYTVLASLLIGIPEGLVSLAVQFGGSSLLFHQQVVELLPWDIVGRKRL